MADDQAARGPADLAGAFADPMPPERRFGSVLWPTLAGALVIGALSWLVAHVTVDQRRAAVLEEARSRAQTLAEANAALIATRVAGLSQLARRITGSELVQVYAASAAGAGEPAGWLADQAPFLTQMFEDFVAQHDLLAASLVAGDGAVILTVGELPEGPALPERAGNGVDPVVTPIYELIRAGVPAGTLAFDIILPIPGFAERDRPSVPALLVMNLEVASTLADEVAAGRLGAPVLTQESGPALEVELGEASPAGAAMVASAPVRGTPWRLVQPHDAGDATARLASFERQVYLLAGGIAAVLSSAFGMFCAVVARRRRRERERARQAAADQARHFSEIFETLADRVPEGIGVKASDGRYVYANQAFGERLGRGPAEIVGKSDAELDDQPAVELDPVASCSPERARELVRAHRAAAGPAIVVLPGEGGARHAPVAEVASVPTVPAGQLSVDHAVAMLVRAVELRDPFLRGHGERVAELAGAVAERIGLNAAERETIELAARLSQVGKIFVPDAILTKPGRHSGDEARIMRGHVEHTLEMLEGVDLGLPAAFVVSQMHERLDGSGYPRALSGDEIGLPGRILGTVDVFCARTAPRAYRDQVSAGQALFHLAGHPEKFDARVVTTLVAIVAGTRGRAPALSAPERADAA